MARVLAFIYSSICYALFLGVFLYAVGFVGNLIVPKSIDSGLESALGTAILINALLLGAFAIQHTIMARIGFKKIWTRVIPKAVERSTFVLFTNGVLALMFWQWQPLTDTIWLVENAIGKFLLLAVFGLGWGIVLLSTFLIDHFDLFGLRQAWCYMRGQEYPVHKFQETGLYGVVRHPIMMGFVIAFWATPHMTLGHLIFSIATTGYILVGIMFEERDLIATLGDDYRRYRERVSMLMPWIPKRDRQPAVSEAPVVTQTESQG